MNPEIALYYPFHFRSLVTYALALNHDLAETLSKNEKSKKVLQKREAEEEEKPESGNHFFKLLTVLDKQ